MLCHAYQTQNKCNMLFCLRSILDFDFCSTLLHLISQEALCSSNQFTPNVFLLWLLMFCRLFPDIGDRTVRTEHFYNVKNSLALNMKWLRCTYRPVAFTNICGSTGACLMGFHTVCQPESWVAERSRLELSACTRGGEKRCNLIAVGPKSGA